MELLKWTGPFVVIGVVVGSSLVAKVGQSVIGSSIGCLSVMAGIEGRYANGTDTYGI